MKSFHSIDKFETANILKTDLARGLTESAAQKRLIKFGINELPKEKVPGWISFIFDQFKSPLIYILCGAAIISLLLKEFIDFGIISVTLIINVGIGFFQEYRAFETLKKLQEMVHFKARIIRAGREKEIDIENIVPGDVIILEAGNKISCDGRLVEINDLSIIEAALTGESMPSSKSIDLLPIKTSLADRENMVYMGTQVASGTGKAIVTATGKDTELGKIASILKETKNEPTPLQKKISRLAKVLGTILMISTLLIFIIGILRQYTIFEMLTTSIAIAVSSIPEGLPAGVAVILALAMQKILKRKGLVKRLVGAETLGSTSIICTDKTGTLTRGEMAVTKLFTWDNKDNESRSLIYKISALCNDALIENPDDKSSNWKLIGNPTEKALLFKAADLGYQKVQLEKESPRLAEIPFSGERKYMATLNQTDNKNIIYIKGAPEKIINLSSSYHNNNNSEKLSTAKKSEIIAKLDELSNKGLRVIAFGYKKNASANLVEKDINGLTLVGLAALKDPLRKEAKKTIKKCKQAGIKIIIVTGDHKLTTKAIAEDLGLKIKDEDILEGQDLDRMNDQELIKNIAHINIFARIEPKHKMRIVKAWQAQGEVVAMIGDGVNDAPALKSADIGVAVGSGTDVTKETADIILLDNNLSTLVAAVEEGRSAYDNIKKITLYLLSDSFAEILLIGISLLIGLPLPLLAAQILWINVVEDGLPSIALAFEKGEKETMKEKPRRLKEPIIDSEMKTLLLFIGAITSISITGLYLWLINLGTYDITLIRTILFAALSLDSLVFVFVCRSLRFTVLHKNPFSNRFLIFGVLVGLAAIIAGIYLPFLQNILKTVPLSPIHWIAPISLAVLELILLETVKKIFIIRKNKAAKFAIKK